MTHLTFALLAETDIRIKYARKDADTLIIQTIIKIDKGNQGQ